MSFIMRFLLILVLGVAGLLQSCNGDAETIVTESSDLGTTETLSVTEDLRENGTIRSTTPDLNESVEEAVSTNLATVGTTESSSVTKDLRKSQLNGTTHIPPVTLGLNETADAGAGKKKNDTSYHENWKMSKHGDAPAVSTNIATVGTTESTFVTQNGTRHVVPVTPDLNETAEAAVSTNLATVGTTESTFVTQNGTRHVVPVTSDLNETVEEAVSTNLATVGTTESSSVTKDLRKSHPNGTTHIPPVTLGLKETADAGAGKKKNDTSYHENGKLSKHGDAPAVSTNIATVGTTESTFVTQNGTRHMDAVTPDLNESAEAGERNSIYESKPYKRNDDKCKNCRKGRITINRNEIKERVERKLRNVRNGRNGRNGRNWRNRKGRIGRNRNERYESDYSRETRY